MKKCSKEKFSKIAHSVMTQWFNFVERSSAHTIHVHNSAHSAARFCTYTAPVIAKLLSGCFSLASGVRAPLATCCRCCHRHRHQQCIASMTDESHKFTTLPRRVSTPLLILFNTRKNYKNAPSSRGTFSSLLFFFFKNNSPIFLLRTFIRH